MKDFKKLEEELKKYAGKNITIRIDGSLKLGISIHNLKSMVTSRNIIFSNYNFKLNEEAEICLDDVIDIKLGQEIIIEMNGNYNIYIST